jgi:hypothetical protein
MPARPGRGGREGRGPDLARNGAVTADQLDMAALLYAGPGSVLTGAAALRRHRLVAPPCARLDVLIPATRRRASHGFARLHRTSRLPELVAEAGPVLFALPPRAVADAVRGFTDLGKVRATVADAVQHGRCPLPRLAEELARGPVQGSARLRLALAEVAGGVRSAAEADLRDLILGAGLPLPMFNPGCSRAGSSSRSRLLVAGRRGGSRGGLARWHLSPAAWQRTMAPARADERPRHHRAPLHAAPDSYRTRRSRVGHRCRADCRQGEGAAGIRAVAAR